MLKCHGRQLAPNRCNLGGARGSVWGDVVVQPGPGVEAPLCTTLSLAFQCRRFNVKVPWSPVGTQQGQEPGRSGGTLSCNPVLGSKHRCYARLLSLASKCLWSSYQSHTRGMNVLSRSGPISLSLTIPHTSHVGECAFQKWIHLTLFDPSIYKSCGGMLSRSGSISMSLTLPHTSHVGECFQESFYCKAS